MKKKKTEQHPHFSVRSVPRPLAARFRLAAMVNGMKLNQFVIHVMQEKIDAMEREGLLPKIMTPVTKTAPRKTQ